MDKERAVRHAKQVYEKDLFEAEKVRRLEEEKTRKDKEDRRRAHERHKRQREDRVKAQEEARKRDEDEYRKKMERLHKEQEREQKKTEAAFRDEREKQDRFRKAQEEYGKCIEDEARGLHVYCKAPVNPDDLLDESEVELSSESEEFESLRPWGSDNDYDKEYLDFSSDYSESNETISLPSLTLESVNSENESNSDSYWDHSNSYDDFDELAYQNRRQPSMPPPPRMKPGKRGKKPKSETIRYPLMNLEGKYSDYSSWFNTNRASGSESDENDMRWQVGEDVRFSLSADDNFDGRDVNVHLNLPDDWNQEHHTTGPHPARAHPHQRRPHAPQAPRRTGPADHRAPERKPKMGPPPAAKPDDQRYHRDPQHRPRMGPPPSIKADAQRTMSQPQADGYREDMYGHLGRHPPHRGPHGHIAHGYPHGTHVPHSPHAPPGHTP